MHNRRLSILIPLFAVLLIGAATLRIVYNNSVVQNHFPLQEQWTTKIGGVATALSTNGKSIIFARAIKRLYALDAGSGRILWRHNLAWQGIPQPVISWNGGVYFADGKAVWALDQENGSILWKQLIPIPNAHVRSVSENIVAVDVASYIYVYDATNGQLLWTKPVCRFGGVQAYIWDSRIYVPCIDKINAMDGRTGKDEWKIEDPFHIAEVAYQDGIMFYSPIWEEISAFDLQNRNVLWRRAFRGEGYRRFSVAGDYLFITDTIQTCALRTDTGDLIWCVEFSNPQNPTTLNDTFYIFNGPQNKIITLNMGDGQRNGELNIRKLSLFSIQKELMVSVGNLIVFGSGNRIFAFGE